MSIYRFCTLVVGVALLIVAGCTSGKDKQAEKSTEEKTAAIDFISVQDTSVRTHKASCRCGELTVTYEGPVPKRRTLCHCNSCQLRTGTAFSIQGRFPRDKAIIKGESTEWRFPNEEDPEVTYRSCDSGGATFHFCPTCGTTVYWDIDAASEIIGIALGTLTDPSFPAPVISAFEAYGHPWAMQPAGLDIIRLEYDELKEKLKEINNKN